MKMKIKNSNFDKLVKKMEPIKETEKGKLKGGVSTLVSLSSFVAESSNYVCNNNYKCTVKQEL